MPKLVLIIDDEDGVSKAVAEVCTGLGLETLTAKTGADGLAKFGQNDVGLVILDILLPGGMDGFKVADQLRGSAAGQKVPLLVVSGFLKDPKAQRDLQAKVSAKGFLQKPLKADDLRSAIGAALGLGARATTSSTPAVTISGEVPAVKLDSFSTDLRQKPVPQLFIELFRGKAEGVLDLTRGQVKKRFYLQRGFFRYATSNVKGETLAGLLPQRGVPEARVNEAVAKAKDEGLALTEALVQLRICNEKDVGGLLTSQTEEVAITALTWPEGSATFRAQAVDSGPEGRANPVLCVLKGLKRLVSPEAARKALEAQRAGIPERTPEFERELFAIRNLFPGEITTPMVNGRTTVGEILAKAKDLDVQLLQALLASGLARLKGSAGATPTPGQPMRPVTTANKPSTGEMARAASAPAKRFTAEETAARDQILAEAARQEAATTHYQVLGVAPQADAAAIKTAYLRLARTFHVDAFAGLALGDNAVTLEAIFKRISEANATLSDPEARADYDLVLDRKAKGLPTDVGELFKAESTFARAEGARKAGRLRDAEKLFREAFTLNPGEASYALALAESVYQLQGKAGARECLELLDKALKLRQDLVPAMMLRGQLLLEGGDAKQALELARKVMELQPGTSGVMDLLRQAKAQLANGGAQAEKGGLLGKLFGGKGK